MNTIKDEAIFNKRKYEKIIKALRLIFWGGLFIVIDFNLSCQLHSENIGMDVFNDSIGLILVSVGLLYLMFIEHNDKYDNIITIVTMISILYSIGSILLIFYPSLNEKLSNFTYLIWLIQNVGLLLFCWSLKILFDDEEMKYLYNRWNTLFILFIFFSILPTGLLLVLQSQINLYNINAFVSISMILFTILQIVPLVYLMLTINKIIQYAKSKVPNSVM